MKFAVKAVMGLALATCFCLSTAMGSQAQDEKGRVEGTVVVRDSTGNSSSVASVKVGLSGAASFETTTDEHGKYVFTGVLPGSYVIHASTIGFVSEQLITVEAGKTETIDLELKPTEVKSSVTVTASEPDKQQPSPSDTIGSQTLRDAPNANERFESAL